MVGVILGYKLYSPAKQKNTNYNARTISNDNLTSTPSIHLHVLLRDVELSPVTPLTLVILL
jgi:hypothetical protein